MVSRLIEQTSAIAEMVAADIPLGHLEQALAEGDLEPADVGAGPPRITRHLWQVDALRREVLASRNLDGELVRPEDFARARLHPLT